jgi:hypothetical protein
MRRAGEPEPTEGFERVVDELGGLFLAERNLRVAVEVPPPRYDFFPDVLYEIGKRYRRDGVSPRL